MQKSTTEADHVGANLSGQAKYRRVARIRGGQRRGGVHHTRAGNDDTDAFLARDAGVAVRHVRRGLLVTGMDDTDRILVLVERIEQTVELHAWKTKDRIDPILLQG